MTRTDAQAAWQRLLRRESGTAGARVELRDALHMLQRAMKEIEGLDRAMEGSGIVCVSERGALLREWGSAPQ